MKLVPTLAFQFRQVTKIKVGNQLLLAKCLERENQHTMKATGLLLWDAAPALAAVLEANPLLVQDKRVLELGCGATALCSLIASNSASTVFATDGDPATMNLLQENIELNSTSFPVKKVACHRLLRVPPQSLPSVALRENIV